MNLEEFLLKNGPEISGVLYKKYASVSGKSVTASKKAISRAGAPINKLHLGFLKNQSFVYHDFQYKKQPYWEKLESMIFEHAGAVADILSSFYYHSGYMYAEHIPAYSCSPIKTLSSRKECDILLSKLIDEEIITVFDSETYKVSESIYNQDNFNRFKWIERLKKQVLEDFALMISRLNMVSYGSYKIIDDAPEFGNFQWCFTSPSYLQGLATKDRTKPGFVVMDILIGRKVEERDIQFFLSKINILRSRKNLMNFLPVLVCDYVDPDAFQRLKKSGVMIALIKEVFGDSYSESLRLLLETLTNATEIIQENPDKIFDLAKSVSSLRGRFGNVKGDLFELVVGYYYNLIGEPIKVGKTITDRDTGKSKEIDVYVNDRTHVRFVECKSYDQPLDKQETINWLDKIPTIKNWVKYQDEMDDKKLYFELWSSSGFAEDSLELLNTRKSGTSKYEIEFYGKPEINNKFKETKNKKLQELMNSYFYKSFQS